jgi:hypothetical protein
MHGHRDDVDLAGGDLDEEQCVDLLGNTVSTVKKSQDTIVCVWAVGNCFEVGPDRPRRGVDPGVVEDLQTVLAATW